LRGDAGPVWKRLAWFVILWAAGVGAVGVVGWLIRLWLR
jgi:preprotein translocase subunit Sss1